MSLSLKMRLSWIFTRQNINFSFFVFQLLFLSACATFSGGQSGVKLPPIQDQVLSNGLKVIVIRDTKLPFINIGLLIGANATQDPLGKSGLNDLTADMLARGSKNMTATQISDAFGLLGTNFTSSSDYDYTYLSTSALAEDEDKILDLFFSVLLDPTFDMKEVNRLKSETIASIKRSYDEPKSVTSRLFRQFLFGSHPYGRSVNGTVRDIQSIQREDILRHYRQHFVPNESTLVLVGDVSNNIIEIVEKLSKNWSPNKIENKKLPQLQPLNGSKILLVNRDDLKQSEVRLGHYGIKRNTEDFLALMVAETILSDGFSSRLMNEIREKRGLTYGISSVFDPRLEVGPYLIYTNTRHEKVGEIIQETMRVFKDFYSNGVTAQEVSDAKGYLRGSFPRSIETPSQMAQMIVTLRYYGVGDDYLKNYIHNLNQITAADVNRAIKKYYHPEQMQIFIYGPQKVVSEQLRPVGAFSVKEFREML